MQLEALETLDLTKCSTVSEIVGKMRHCAFGARMLGETADTLTQWVNSKEKPIIIYDGRPDTALVKLLEEMVRRSWFARIVAPEQLTAKPLQKKNLLVIGRYSDRHADCLYRNAKRIIFINRFGLAKPGQIKDGYFPDAVFSEARLIVPIIFVTLQERLENKKTNAAELIKELDNYGGLASEVAAGAKVLKAMFVDPECTVFLTLSGAMTIAKMGFIICDMIDNNMIRCISSTGALMAHGLVEGVGLKHYKYNPKFDDVFLSEMGLNRVTDTLEPETNLDSIEKILDDILNLIDASKPISPSILHRHIGEYLVLHFPKERAILKSAFEKNIPIFIPAPVDSEIGNDIYVHNLKRKAAGKPRIILDTLLDTEKLIELATAKPRIGIFSIGGGVPRNNTQNVAPLIEIINNRTNLNLRPAKFSYGCRIAPDPMWYGHLSGCTYSEGKSWHKMDAAGQFAGIHTDATLVLPFLAKYLMENLA